ncbi:MAG TPA: carbonic anhydrase [bacterium]|nr:carbonic anhydrase [bacterium]
MTDSGPVPGDEALERLLAGNRRFMSGQRRTPGAPDLARMREIVPGRRPFATVLGCADARVPPELLFDQDVGDVFVVRVAGNVVGPTQLGSVEFAVERFDTRLVLVMGHLGCGAVLATLDWIARPDAPQPASVRAILDRIRPAVEPILMGRAPTDPAALEARAVRANVRSSVHELRHGSPVMEERVRAGDVLVVGAQYSPDTGEVEILSGARAAG